MNELQWVQVVNKCAESVTVFVRHTRPKRGLGRRPGFFALEPGQESKPLPSVWLVGARGWKELSRRPCITIKSVTFDPRFVQLLNRSGECVQLAIKIRRPKAPPKIARFTVKPKEKSRTIDLKAIREKKKLKHLVLERKLKVVPVLDIGPATGRGRALGSYYQEDVYTCYECGGPIIFRGDPPTPVHI